ncbi:MAG: hypothetical protein GX915_02870 [Clostridiales bacterium]|nr:hypothetical protein [Clostridiales bacterium]
MNTNQMTDATKIILLAATTLITCILVSLGFISMRSAKELNETAISQMADLNDGLKDSDIKMFDNIDVYGSEIINLIKKELGDYEEGETGQIYVYVKTSTKDNTYYNGSQISDLQNFTNENYIKATAVFKGKVDKNKNGVILGVQFTQI